MPFAEDQDMIQAVAPKCPDQALTARQEMRWPTVTPTTATLGK